MKKLKTKEHTYRISFTDMTLDKKIPLLTWEGTESQLQKWLLKRFFVALDYMEEDDK